MALWHEVNLLGIREMASGKKQKLLIFVGLLLVFVITISLWGHFYLPVEIFGNEASLGANVYVDGQLKGKFDRRVIRIRVKRGLHQFRISKQGFQDSAFDTAITTETYLDIELHPVLDTIKTAK